ncbi:hypothetical protein Pint_01577 [Pistacia integerrima]|uniref:Uncharacterized protein n=1 Tax=Pistacia integerrima TaxID=434235 RepID=A0ACC0ZGX1_9ROSI|nr:hypothetical protein Pint_01577 [Pistacia integerrima]
MNTLLSASSPTSTFCSYIQSKPQQNGCLSNPFNSVTVTSRTLPCSSDLKLKGLSFGGARPPQRLTLQCNSSTKPSPPGSGDGDSRNILDAFFLGKAVAEAVNERVESAVGEFFSTIGRLQAEQQKQVQEFQEDVFERAKKAKEKAAREAMEARGHVPKSSTENTTSVTLGSTSTASPVNASSVTPASPSSSYDPITPTSESDPNPAEQVSDED